MHNQDQTRAGEPAPLLATKLYLPRQRPHLIVRPRLVARLQAGSHGTLTLIAAPAGFGKTTLLTDWLRETGGSERQVAWLALDAGDSDPNQFLRYLIAALQTIAPSVGATVLPLLQTAQTPPLERLMAVLANELVAVAEPSILVLDDYHAIDAPAVHQALAFLLDHLPPQIHVVIASRVDPPLPLSRWRVRGQLTELRAHDLRFTNDEAAAFLQDMLGMGLTAADVAALEARTEGWIAGLQLAALSLRNRPDAQISAFIESFTGGHRFVVDYLVDEVLARQPAHLLFFLLRTAILQRLCSGLCHAVVGNGAGSQAADSQLVLEHLERANLFIIPLDDARRWYRYHHLFAHVLHERLLSSASPAEIAMLHRRAASWLEQNGLIVDAMHHVLAGQDWDTAARLIETHGRWLTVRGYVHAVRGWMNALPDSVLRAHPYLNLIHALGLFFMNELEAAERFLDEAGRQLPPEPQDDRARSILGYATILRSSIARFRGDLVTCVPLARRGLEVLPPTDASGRMAASVHVAEGYLLSGDASAVSEQPLVAAVAAARSAGELTNLLYALVALAAFQRSRGQLRQAAATYRDAAQLIPEPSGLQAMPNGANYYFGLGDLLLEWNDLQGAEQLLAQGREMVRGGRLAQGDSIVVGYTALARIQWARGDGSGAMATLAELQDEVHRRKGTSNLIDRVKIAGARLSLAQGDRSAADRWAATRTAVLSGAADFSHEQAYLTLARVRVAQAGHGESPAALGDMPRVLDRLLTSAEASGRLNSVIQILIVRALVQQATSDHSGASHSLARALQLGAPEGYVRSFVDEGAPMAALLAQAVTARSLEADIKTYAAQLLDVLGKQGGDREAGEDTPAASAQPELFGNEHLTEREIEVLGLLAVGRSNQAIADELVIAIGTVKRHVNSIMGKLQVESRLEAVVRAREIGLV